MTNETATATITEKERAMLHAMATSDYAEGPTDDVWMAIICKPFGDSAGGIMASLVKKGLARTTGHIDGAWVLDDMGRSTGLNEATCACTTKGASLL
jgi:hypothetical protein